MEDILDSTNKIHNLDIITLAKYFAIEVHGNQRYSEYYPYSAHLEIVYEIGCKYTTDKDIKCAFWLHDSIEDGATSYNKIKKEFNERIAEIVYCVSDEMGRNRQERKAKTYPKIRSRWESVLVKLVDRMANLTWSLKTNSRQLRMYAKEHETFKAKLFDPLDPPCVLNAWEDLETLIGKCSNHVTEKN